MATVEFTPTSLWLNDGWVVTGGAGATLAQVWTDTTDTTYATAPANRGKGEVGFPINSGILPEGSVIDSVTIVVRAARIGSSPRPVTAEIVAADEESRFESRTFYPTTTIADYEVASYARDPLGFKWDAHRLNNVRARMLSSPVSGTDIRVYQMYLKVTYRTQPSVTIGLPSGLERTPSPALSWTYSHPDADRMSGTEYRVFTAAQTQALGFNPDVDDPVYTRSISGETTSEIYPDTLASGSYALYLRVTSESGAVSDWAVREFDVLGIAPAVPGNDNQDSTAVPGIGVPSVVADSHDSSVTIRMRDASNLLSYNQADLESSLDSIGYTATNCDLDRDFTVTYSTSKASLKLTATADANVSAQTGWVDIGEEIPYTATVQVRSETVSRTSRVSVAIYDSTYTLIGINPATVASVVDGWVELTVTGTTSAESRYARLTVEFEGALTGEIHYADRVGLMYGTGASWTDGGFASRNMLTAHQSTGDLPFSGTLWVAGNEATEYVLATPPDGVGADTTWVSRLEYLGVAPSIAFRDTGTGFVSSSSTNAFTLNRPAAAADGDLLVAYVSTDTPTTIYPPSGWTLVNASTAGDDTQLYVLMFDATGADPASWSGSFADNVTRLITLVVAYSGTAPTSAQFLAEKTRSQTVGNPDHTTATLNNPDSNAWRIGAIVAAAETAGTWTVNEVAPSAPPEITYVGRGPVYRRRDELIDDWSIYRPEDAKAGDLMVAFAVFTGNITVTTPVGWTLVNVVQTNPGAAVAYQNTLAIYMRDATSSDPSTWSSTVSGAQRPALTWVHAWRNVKPAAQQTLLTGTEAINTSGGSQITTASIIPDTSNNRVITGFSATFDLDGRSPTPVGWADWSSDVPLGLYDGYNWSTVADIAITMSQYTSDGPVSAGQPYFRTGYLNQPFGKAVAWAGVLLGLDTIPSAGANEVERTEHSEGASDPRLNFVAFDSNAPVATGLTNVTASLATATGIDGSASWLGLITPFNPIVTGSVGAELAEKVDISNVDPRVIEWADHKITYLASFIGSTGGQPLLTLEFYRASELLRTVTAEGQAFNTTVWTHSKATFDLPEGTTHIMPKITAANRDVSDTVQYGRVSLAFGDSDVYRIPTGEPEHPVWMHPVIQYSDDDGTGYGEWKTLPGLINSPPVFDQRSGECVHIDHTVVPLNNRKYRVRSVSYGLAGDRFVSGYGPETDEVLVTAQNWWLKDLDDPDSNIALRVKAEPTSVSTTNTDELVYPLGEEFPLVQGEGYKADQFELTVVATREEHANIKKLMRRGKTLLLQSDVDDVWWVRLVGDFQAETQVTGRRKTNPIRFVTLRFAEVKPEE